MLHEVQYFDNGEVACYNGYSFRRDKKTGYYLSSQVIGKRRARLHRYVWEIENGRKIPEGYDIHHVDGDKANNYIGNLLLVTREQHRFFHELMNPDGTYERRVKNLKEKALPEAVKWHKSEKGKEFHSQHGKAVMAKRKPIKYICTQCGKEFTSTHIYGKEENTFCGNNCRAAFRRASGVDNIEMECKYCGEKYLTNKYSPAKYCPKHRSRKYRV